MNKISLIRGLKNRFENNDVVPLYNQNLHESCNCAIEENMKEGALFNVIIKALNRALKHCKKSSKEITQIFREIETAQACRHFLRNLPGHPSPRKGQKKATSMPPAALVVLRPSIFALNEQNICLPQ